MRVSERLSELVEFLMSRLVKALLSEVPFWWRL